MHHALRKQQIIEPGQQGHHCVASLIGRERAKENAARTQKHGETDDTSCQQNQQEGKPRPRRRPIRKENGHKKQEQQGQREQGCMNKMVARIVISTPTGKQQQHQPERGDVSGSRHRELFLRAQFIFHGERFPYLLHFCMHSNIPAKITAPKTCQPQVNLPSFYKDASALQDKKKIDNPTLNV